MPRGKTTDVIEVKAVDQQEMTIRLIGLTPFIMNAVSRKAQATLLLGGTTKTRGERQKTIKHNPLLEFRESMYTTADGPTMLHFPASSIKSAMRQAAIDTGGVTGTQIARNIFIPYESICIWGVPHLRCDVVRSQDAARTPDIRTRACMPEWATEVTIRFTDTFTPNSIMSLLLNAGIMSGLGDYRQEKGKASFGSYQIVSEQDPEGMAEWDRIVETCGREPQEAAFRRPHCLNEQSAELLILAAEEFKRRSMNMDPDLGIDILEMFAEDASRVETERAAVFAKLMGRPSPSAQVLDDEDDAAAPAAIAAE